MKYGLGVNVNETTTEVVKKSIQAEQLGLDYVWVSDIPPQRYPFTVASAVASGTRKLRIGVGLLSCFLYTPKQIADGFVTLVEAYGNRFELLLGPGDKEQLQRVGVQLLYSKGIDKYILNSRMKIEKLLQKSKIHGKIWLGAQGPKILGIAHSFDGVFLNYASLELVKWATSLAQTRHKKEFQIGVYAPSYVYSSLNEKVKRFLRYASAVVAMGSPDFALKTLGIKEKIAGWKRKLESNDNMAFIFDDISPEIVEAFSIHKSVEELKSYVTKMSDLGVKHMVFSYPQGSSRKTIEDLAQALF